MPLAALSACLLSSACAAATIGAGANVGLYALQERTIGEGFDDATISQQVKVRLMTADRAAFREVDVEVAGQNVLLSGAAPSDERRAYAEQIAQSVGGVRAVYNEIVIGAGSNFSRSARDEWISAQIRARLAASRSVRVINVNIETFHGAVYLMGQVRSQRELERAAEIAASAPGVTRVVSLMYLRAPVQTFADADARAY